MFVQFDNHLMYLLCELVVELVVTIISKTILVKECLI